MTSERTPVRLLLVEDSFAQARYIQQTLLDTSSPQIYEVAWAESLADTLSHLTSKSLDLVLLDLVLPDSDGIDTFAAVHQARPDVPIIVLSGAGDETTALRAVAEGAQDYLSKSALSPQLLTRSIQYALERHRNLVEFQHLALRDELTGLHNRRGFMLVAEQQLAVARRASSPITVMFVDVDGLKFINDTYGHQSGDQALADVAALMKSTFRNADVIGRIGGDEFCGMLLDDGAESTTALPAEARFQAAIDGYNASGTHAFTLSCTVGTVTRKPSHDLAVADLLSEADGDMYDNRRHHRPSAPPVSDDRRRQYSKESAKP